MNAMTAMALALFLGQAQADGSTISEPTSAQAPVVPADATGPVMTLDEALQLAGERSLDLKALSAQLDQAGEITWKALSGYLPQVAVGASFTLQSEVKSAFAVPLEPDYAAGGPHPVATGFVDLEQQKNGLLGAQVQATQVLLSPRLYFAIRGAKESQRAAVLSIENGRRQVLFGVARAYYGAAALKEALGVSERLLEISQRQEKDARVRYQAGAIAKVGLLRAQIDRARAEEDVKRAGAAYLSTKVALASLLARDTAFEVTSPPEPALPGQDLDGLVGQALQARPDVEAARIKVRAEEENRSAVRSRLLPDVQAFGKYQWANMRGLNGEHGAWYAGLQLQWTLFDGLRLQSDSREAEARIVEAKARSDGAVVEVRKEVTQALLDLESARANAQKSKEQRDLATENQRLVDVAYRAGTATAVEQADATAQLRNAEILVTTDALSVQLAALNVLNALGSFNPTKP